MLAVVWSVSFIWLNQTNQSNQIDQMNQINPTSHRDDETS